MSILHYKEDWRSILFTVLCLGMLLIPFYYTLPDRLVPVWIILSGLFCFNACVINHNHVHSGIFHHQVLNSVFGVLLSLARGHTSAGIILAHNYNHHRFNGGPRDWIRPQLAGRGPGLVRLITFIVRAVICMARGRHSADKQLLPHTVKQQMRLEKSILILFIAAMLLIDMNIFVTFVATAWLIGVILLIGVNLLQHDGCESGSTYNHSRNFTGRLGNWLFFNNGYHTAHHIDPSLHWSKLKTFHKRDIAPHIDSSLEVKSIMGFLFRNYFIAR